MVALIILFQIQHSTQPFLGGVHLQKEWFVKVREHQHGGRLNLVLHLKRDALLKRYMGSQADMEEAHALFCMCNSLILSKGLLYISTMPKGEMEGVLASLSLWASA